MNTMHCLIYLFIYFKYREVYHTKRMQHVICIKWSADNKYILSGSDEMNIRLWKANAAEKLGMVSPASSSLRRPCFHLYFQLQSMSYLRATCCLLVSRERWSLCTNQQLYFPQLSEAPHTVSPPSDLVLWVSCILGHGRGPGPTSAGWERVTMPGAAALLVPNALMDADLG